MSLADRKECSTNTTGFGPEWRSNTWWREGRLIVKKKKRLNSSPGIPAVLKERISTLIQINKEQNWAFFLRNVINPKPQI